MAKTNAANTAAVEETIRIDNIVSSLLKCYSKNVKKVNWSKLVLAIGITEGAGIVGSVFTAPAIKTWYSTLIKPSFNPPNSQPPRRYHPQNQSRSLHS